MAEKVTLKDETTGVTVYPQTLVDSVQDEAGNLLKTLVLMLNNTMAFTPTGDYNPATKKYVDDALASSSAGIDIAVQSAQPSGQNMGDFWYQVT